MIPIELQSDSQASITVTSTATSLYDLMATASTTGKNVESYYAEEGANCVLLKPEDGDIRFMFEGTPTSSLGFPLGAGSPIILSKVNLGALKLIRSGSSNVTVSLQLFKAENGQSSAIAGGAGGTVTNPSEINIDQINGEDAGLYQNSVTKASRVEVSNLPSPLNDSPVDTTNLSATTHYFPSSDGGAMGNNSGLTFSGKLIDADNTTTIKLQGSNDEDATNADWKDIAVVDANSTTPATLVANFSVTSGTLIYAGKSLDFGFSRYRFAVTCGDATNTVILKINLIP